MSKKIVFLFAAILYYSNLAHAQMVLKPGTDAYNWPYDSLVKSGHKGANKTLKEMGIKTPYMAIMYYNRAIEVDKSRPEAHVAKGEAYLLYEMLDEAVEAFNAGLETNPDNPGCLYGLFYASFLGSKKYQLNDVPKPMVNQVYNSAMAFLAVAPATMAEEKGNAKNLGFLFKLAKDDKDLFAKYNLNNVDKPTEENIKALEAIVLPVEATKNPSMVADIYDKIIIYYSTTDYAKVKTYAVKAIATAEARVSTYYYYAKTLFFQDKNPIEAEKICDAGLKLGPNSYIKKLKSNIYDAEGKKAYELKDYLKAAANFQKYVDLNDDDETGFAYAGFSFYNAKKYPESAKNLKALKKIAEPLTVKILYANLDALIVFSEKPGPTPPAIQSTFVEVLKQEETINKAVALYDEKKFDESIALLTTVLPYFEQSKNPVELSVIYSNLGFNYQNKKEFDKAKEYYLKSIQAGGPASSGAYENQGLLLYALDKNFTDAEKLLKEGSTKYPNSRYIAERLGQMYAARGDVSYDKKEYENAIADYKTSLTYSEDAQVYVFLGFSYYFTKQKDQCLEAMENAKYMDSNITTTYPAINQVINNLK